jgi:hypothetical protein
MATPLPSPVDMVGKNLDNQNASFSNTVVNGLSDGFSAVFGSITSLFTSMVSRPASEPQEGSKETSGETRTSVEAKETSGEAETSGEIQGTLNENKVTVIDEASKRKPAELARALEGEIKNSETLQQLIRNGVKESTKTLTLPLHLTADKVSDIAVNLKTESKKSNYADGIYVGVRNGQMNINSVESHKQTTYQADVSAYIKKK